MSLSFFVQKFEPTDVVFTYIGFNSFRHRIARSIGLNNVYAGTKTDMYQTGKYKEISERHPLYEFISNNDSDCKMEPDDCHKAGECLKTIVKGWEEIAFYGYSDESMNFDIEMGKKMVDLLLRCYENDETLLFV